jgi:hypothetical protein
MIGIVVKVLKKGSNLAILLEKVKKINSIYFKFATPPIYTASTWVKCRCRENAAPV